MRVIAAARRIRRVTGRTASSMMAITLRATPLPSGPCRRCGWRASQSVRMASSCSRSCASSGGSGDRGLGCGDPEFVGLGAGCGVGPGGGDHRRSCFWARLVIASNAACSGVGAVSSRNYRGGSTAQATESCRYGLMDVIAAVSRALAIAASLGELRTRLRSGMRATVAARCPWRARGRVSRGWRTSAPMLECEAGPPAWVMSCRRCCRCSGRRPVAASASRRAGRRHRRHGGD